MGTLVRNWLMCIYCFILTLLFEVYLYDPANSSMYDEFFCGKRRRLLPLTLELGKSRRIVLVCLTILWGLKG